MRKRAITLTLALLMCLSCAACGSPADVSGNSPQPEKTFVPNSESTDEPMPKPAGKPPVENDGFEVGEGYQYYLYSYDARVPVLGMNFPYGWYNSSMSSIKFEDREYIYYYGFGPDLRLGHSRIQNYGYFTNSEGEIMSLYMCTRAEIYFDRAEDYNQVELQVNGEYTVDTPYGQWTVQQVILWQNPQHTIGEPDETKTVDGVDWYGFYAEVAMVNNGGHEICIWLEKSDKDSTYLKDIFADIL